MIQAKKNRQEKINVSQIDSALDEEFAEYRARLNDQIERMNAALERSQGTLLSDEESRELKKLYRAIVKALHPDLHPDLTDAQLQLFLNAVEAYGNGDLDGLRVIDTMVAEPVLPDEKADCTAVLVEEKERLLRLLQSIKDRIAEIKSEYPYTMKDFLQSPEKVDARKSELQG